MDQIFLQPRAKINVTLNITGRRADGYHEIDTVMQTAALCDEMLIKKTARGVELLTNLKYLPSGEKNLAHAACSFMLEKYKINSGVRVELKKNIPVSAGLGGGSADCAAALVGMRDLFNLPVVNDELIKISKRFGADVPFCVIGGTARARGIGEILTPLSPHPKCHVLIARPPIIVSTAEVFKEFNIYGDYEKPDTEAVIEGIENKNLKQIAEGIANVLESVTEKKYPVISRIKKIMLESGALGALMSGSGPSVFGYFTDFNHAEAAAETIRETESVKKIFLTEIYN